MTRTFEVRKRDDLGNEVSAGRYHDREYATAAYQAAKLEVGRTLAGAVSLWKHDWDNLRGMGGSEQVEFFGNLTGSKSSFMYPKGGER